MSTDMTENAAPQTTEPAAPKPNDLGQAVRNVLRQPSFMITAAILLVCAIGLNSAVNFMQLHFKKEPVSLKHELGTIPPRFATWVQVTQDQPLSSEMQEQLGTTKYIFRDYVDERVVGAGVADRFKDKSTEERSRIVHGIRKQAPAAVVRLSVTYYTGMVDTVAHVPDRCVTADGYEPKSYEEPHWPIARDLQGAVKGGSDNIKVRYINFENQTGTSNEPCNISYFFSVNGKFACSPLDVRGELANLFETKAYYAKIEIMTTMDDPKHAERVMIDFLTSVMPDVMRCMPDWEKEHGRPSKIEQTAAAN